jgi:cytochrome bd-type quinol oxidase subunit 2
MIGLASVTTSLSTIAPILAALLAGGAVALYATTRRIAGDHRSQFTTAVAILALAVAALQLATITTRNTEAVRTSRAANRHRQEAILANCTPGAITRHGAHPSSPRQQLAQLYITALRRFMRPNESQRERRLLKAVAASCQNARQTR